MLTLWKVTRAAFSTTAKVLLAQLRGDGDEGDDASAAAVDDATVLSQLGVAVRPIVSATLRAWGIEHGDEVVVAKLWDRERSPTDLDEGETRLFAAGAIATAVRLLAARIDVVADRINLGPSATKKVNREGDAVDCGTLVFTPNVGTTPAVLVFIPPGGTVPPVSPPTVAITLSGKTGPGSNKVRAED